MSHATPSIDLARRWRHAVVRLVTTLLVLTGLQLLVQATTTPAGAVAAPAVDTPSLLHGNGARLTWRRAPDSDFLRYEVHRSTTSDFSTDTAATKLVEIGYRPLTMFTDTTAKGGTTYFYKIVTVATSGRAETQVAAELPASGTSRLVVPATPGAVAATTIGDAASTADTPCGDDTSWGAGDRLLVGTDETWIQRAMLRFDLRDIPAAAEVTSADLVLSHLATTNTDTGVEARRMTQRWVEGSAAEPGCATGAGATWRESAPGVGWRGADAAEEGGVFANGVESPTAGTRPRSSAGTDTFDLTDMVQSWADGAPNFGLLLKQATEDRAAPSRLDYHSDDAATATQRPRLTVTWNDASKTSTTSFSVATTSPAAGQTTSGVVRLGADVSTAAGQVSVKYFIGSTQVGTADTEAPFTYDWASTGVPDGSSHTFRAEVTNAAGQVKSSSVTFGVDNSPAPTGVTIQSPAAGSTLKGNVTVTATAADDKAVKEVVLTVNGTVAARDTAAPWNLVWDTSDPFVAGYRSTPYVLQVEAVDGSGRSTESAARTVYVDNDASLSKLYRATFGLNAYGASTEAFELPPTIDSNQTTATALSEATPTGDGNLGTKSLSMSSEPTCDACSTTTTTTTGGSTTQRSTQKDDGTSPLEAVIEQPVTDDGGAIPGTGGGGSTNNPKPLADGSFRLDVDVTNTSPVAWKSGGPGGVGLQLWYRWFNDEGRVVYEAPGNDYFPNNLKSGASKTIPVLVRQPPLLNGAQRDRLRLRFDIFDSENLTWFADRGNKPAEQPVVVNHGLSGNLGLEKYWQYEQLATGGGGNALVNISNGNLLWRYSPSATPGRGIATLVDLTYNSLEEHSDSPAGENVSLNISGLLRFGSRLDVHPNKADTLNGQSRRYVRFIDGDGTLHEFTGAVDASGAVRWTEPAGVNLYLTSSPNTSDPRRYWRMTRPDGLTYWFDQDGYPTLVQDRNDNVLEFVLAATEAGSDPGGPKKRVMAIKDAGGRSYAVDYFEKDEVQGGRVRGNVQALVDHSGSKLVFDYYRDGNLRTLTQVGGVSAQGVAVADRTMVFTYTNPKGDAPAILDAGVRKDPPASTTQSVKLYSVIDYRGNETTFAYWGAQPDAKNRWKLKSWTNREQDTTTFTHNWSGRVTTSDAPMQRDYEYTYDTTGKATRIVNPKEEATSVIWTTDNKVSKVTLPTGKTQQFDYDSNGYTTQIVNEAGEVNVLDYHRRPVDSADTGNHLGFIKSRTLPKGVASTADPLDHTWSFGVDARGNTTTVTDPEGTRTASVATDYTTSYTYGAPGTSTAGLVTALTQPEGGRTTFEYTACGLMSKMTDPVGAVTTFGYDADCRTVWEQDAEHQTYSGDDVRSYRTYFDFDEFGRLVRRSTPKSTRTVRGQLAWTVAKFDANDNTVRDLLPVFGDQSGSPDPDTAPATVVTYDRQDRPVLVAGPDKSIDPEGERTRYVYDAAGRQVSTTNPKGVDSAAQDYELVTEYDVLDRPISVSQFGAAGATPRRSFGCFDLAGDLVAAVGPRANRTSVDCGALAGMRFVSRFDYDAAHRLIKVTDPEGRISTNSYDQNGAVEQVGKRITRTTPERWHRTTMTYDQRGLVVQRKETFADRPELATVTRYDQDGREVLQASPRAVDADGGAGNYADFATRSEYDAAGRLVRKLLPKQGSGEQHYVHLSYDLLGRVAWQSLPTTQSDPARVSALAKTEQTYFDTGWVRTLDKNAVPGLLYDYDALGMQTSRVPAMPGTDTDWNYDKRVTWTYTLDGQRATQTERDGGTSTWTYDLHNQLVAAKDPSGVAAGWDSAVETRVQYNGFDETAKVRTRKSGAPNWTFSSFSYNEDGAPVVRLENGRETDDEVQVERPRRVELTYDDAGFMLGQLNLGSTDGCDGDERLAMAYTDAGWEKSRDLWRGGAGCGADPGTWDKRQSTTWDHYDNGLLKQLVTKNGAGVTTESHDIGYTTDGGRYEDGNRVLDRYVLERAEGAAAGDCTVAAPCEHKYTYDARGRVLIDQIKADNIVRYTLDEPEMLRGDDTIRAGNVTTQVKLGTTTKQYYQGGQVVESEASTGGATTSSKFWYDEYGNQDCVTTGAGTHANCNGPRDKAHANVVQEYTYDDFNRMLGQAKYTGGGAPTDYSQYVYDALDRLIEETEDHGRTETEHDRTTDFSFIGLTTQVGQEVQIGGDDPRTKTYSYNAQGQRIAMTDQLTGSSDTTQTSFSYGVDVHGSVSQLLTDDGKVKASYGYDAYGNADTGDTGTGSESSLTTGDVEDRDPFNPYRFSGKRLDSGTASEGQNATGMDMGARRFGLDTGRFLQEDMFMSSLGDLGLSMDPLSQNRYALAGGNPVSNIEIDGHLALADGGGGGTSGGGTTTTSTSTESTSSSSSDDDDEDRPWYEDAWSAIESGTEATLDKGGDYLGGAAYGGGQLMDLFGNCNTISTFAGNCGEYLSGGGFRPGEDLGNDAADALGADRDSGWFTAGEWIGIPSVSAVGVGGAKLGGKLLAKLGLRTGARAATPDTLQGLATSSFSKVSAQTGQTKGPVFGTKVHSEFKAQVDALGRSDLHTEVSYKNGRVVPYGTKGSVRLDVVEGSQTSPTAIYDLKTGSASLTQARIQQIKSHLPAGYQYVPVSEVRP